ncbi:MAG: hypothetical protein ACR2HV_05965, partial [Acidimicrobiales bacterium]
GSYFTGMLHPEQFPFPGGEHTPYSLSACVRAADALAGTGPASGLFRAAGESVGSSLAAPE